MKRREFLTLVGGAAAWPLVADAQDRMRRIGVLLSQTDDPVSQRRIAAFLQALQQLGWNEGRNLRIDYRWGGGDASAYRKYAAELVALTPDVILAYGGATVVALQQSTRTIPIVFVSVIDPVGAGFIASLSRPGGNVTGFTAFEYGMSGKWLEILKQVVPTMKRVAVLRDPSTAAGIGQFAAIRSVAQTFGVEIIPADVRDVAETKRTLTEFMRNSGGGLIVTGSGPALTNQSFLVKLVAELRLPAIYQDSVFATAGGLISYGHDRVEQFRLAAGYVDRILKGAKPAELPVQQPTKYELVINLKTAKALNISIPPSLLSTANEVIE